MDDIAAVMKTFIKAFEEGRIVPSVGVADIKQMWTAKRRINEEMQGRTNIAIGMGAYAAYGVDAARTDPPQVWVLSLRVELLEALAERGILRDYVRGEEPDEKAFAAAATIPFNKEDWAEALLPLKLSDFEATEPTAVAKARKLLEDARYDLAHPRIGEKFIAWLRDNGG